MRERFDNGHLFEEVLWHAMEFVGLHVERRQEWDRSRKVDFVIYGTRTREIPRPFEVQLTLHADDAEKIRGFLNARPVLDHSLKLYAEVSAYSPQAVAEALVSLVKRTDLPPLPQCVRIEGNRLRGPWDMRAHLVHLGRVLDPQHPGRRFGKVIRFKEETRQAVLFDEKGRLYTHLIDRIPDPSLRGRLVKCMHVKGPWPPVPVTFIPFRHEGKWFASYMLQAHNHQRRTGP